MNQLFNVCFQGFDRRTFVFVAFGLQHCHIVVFLVANIGQFIDFAFAVIFDFFDDQKHVGVVNDGIPHTHIFGNDELVGFFDFVDFLFNV